MKRKRFTEEQIIGILREQEAGAKLGDLARKHGVSETTLDNWKAKFGGIDVSDAKRLKALEDENGKLKRLLADAMLDNTALKDLLSKNDEARRQA
jgi:putative transposase